MKTGKIYAIQNPDKFGMYIGSTRIPLCTRLAQHRAQYKFYAKGGFHYLTSFDIMEGNDPYIELLEDLGECTDAQLLAREGYYIDMYNHLCYNSKHPTGKNGPTKPRKRKFPLLEPILP